VTFDLIQESNQRNGTQQITKQGWLYKGPDNGLETSIMSFTKVRGPTVTTFTRLELSPTVTLLY